MCDRVFWGGECDRTSSLPILQNNLTVGAYGIRPSNYRLEPQPWRAHVGAPLPKLNTMSRLSGRSQRIRIENIDDLPDDIG
ncbi:hypothetical protein [Coleofasciculus sp. E2-BRE-01]|uniref:hypothetical protein n=1 Tax=Coleofasciculus sp. E2-BRE-01 TaxID=3069524 RepID=UPI0032F3439B